MSERIKPCPFCGGVDNLYCEPLPTVGCGKNYRSDEPECWWAVKCTTCGNHGPTARPGPEMAIASWSQRLGNKELTAAQSRIAGHIEHIKSLEAEVAELRAIKFKRFSSQDYWIYQGDGSDHLESLVCPVVMSAQQVMEFEKAKSRVKELEQENKTLNSYIVDLAESQRDKDANLTADNARLRELLRECDYWLDLRFTNDHPIRLKIKAAIESPHDAT